MAFTVSPVAPGELTAACRVLFASDSDTLSTRNIDPNGLFVAKDERGVIRGAVLVQVLPGATGVIVPPRVPGERERIAIEDALVSESCGRLRSQGVKVCQAFASEKEQPAMLPLTRGGFEHVTQLSNMRREIDAEADRLPAGCVLDGEFFFPQLRDTFSQLLLGTFEGTFDCPELNGLRTADEVFDGYTPERGRITGPWFLVKEAGRPIGVVMLDRSGEPGDWEIAYLGLVPEARGRGWGGKLVRFALDQAARGGARALRLCVDPRNNPAIRLYRRNGFIEHDRQDVYLAIWPGQTTP